MPNCDNSCSVCLGTADNSREVSTKVPNRFKPCRKFFKSLSRFIDISSGSIQLEEAPSDKNCNKLRGQLCQNVVEAFCKKYEAW